MIPKIIHFCWLSGDAYPELIKKCMDSWNKICPDYEVVCWNTKNFDINICDYTKEAFAQKKYAFVSDYIRLYALYHYGGIYLDSDIEVMKKFDDLLDNKAFTSFEKEYTVAAWIFGSEKGNPIFKEFLDYYRDRHFVLPDGTMDLTPNPIPITQICKKHGLMMNGMIQKLDYITIYSKDFFCPYDRATEKLNITENTHTIHYFNGSWISDGKKKIIERRKQVIKKYGKFAGYVYYGLGVWKEEGSKQFLKEMTSSFRK